YTYRELAESLIPYLTSLNYTHVELMPIAEHPFYGSWGYQPVGLFSPTARYGHPDDLKYFIDACHQAGLGVVMDWVPAHFPADGHGLAYFDGSPLYHDPDPRRGWHQDWNSYIYDYSKDHVRRFLISNALYWFEMFHIDGLRVDAVASMIYLDYSREHDQWLPNEDGGNHNYDAISLLRWMNEEIYQHYPNAMTIAEESTAFTGVSQPTYLNGLGFGFKWNMGWMHDSLSYFSQEPIHRQYHHNTLTFPLIYAFSENYVLSLSHDEVVHGKGALIDKMPGDEWQQTANLRAYFGYMYGQPGKKLNFMGSEFGQTREWQHDEELQWWLLEHKRHQGIQHLIKDLNRIYQQTPALYEQDSLEQGFAWRVQDDYQQSVIAHERYAFNGDKVLVVSNFTPVVREHYRIGVPDAGIYHLLVNTDDNQYWGSGLLQAQSVETQKKPWHGYPYSIELTLPSLATLFYQFKAASKALDATQTK
ncbi:MAG: 1,4-alpha-glucan branching protein GlgB, partial [Vibrio sp.]